MLVEPAKLDLDGLEELRAMRSCVRIIVLRVGVQVQKVAAGDGLELLGLSGQLFESGTGSLERDYPAPRWLRRFKT